MGGGAWATACAQVLADAGNDVWLWARDHKVVDDINSNQQLRFITLLDVIYDKGIPIAVTASQNLDKFTSSMSLENQFKMFLD